MSTRLVPNRKIARKLARKAMETAGRSIPAVVISAGLMNNTVKARMGVQEWNTLIKKNFSRNKNVLVHDPNNSLRTGDIISISCGWRVSKSVRHIVEKIIAPFGVPAEDRPPVPTHAERMKISEEKRLWKLENRKKKRRGLFTPSTASSEADAEEGEQDLVRQMSNLDLK